MVPNKIEVGGFTYNVIVSDELLNNGNSSGTCDSDKLEIRICNHVQGEVCDDEILFGVLLHEVLHAVDRIYLGDVLSEEDVVCFSEVLHFCLVFNNFMERMEYIQVLGYRYRVKYGNFGSSDEYVSKLYNSKLLIEVTDVGLSKDLVLMYLFQTVYLKSLHLVRGEDFSNGAILCHGLWDVIVRNDLNGRVYNGMS